MSHITATSPVDINVVGESFADANLDSYVWSKMPQATVLDSRAGRNGTTTYEIPALGNALDNATSGLVDWRYGDAIPADRGINHSTVTVKVREIGTDRSIMRPSRRDYTHRLADLETNITPLLLGQLYGSMETLMVDFIEATFTAYTTWDNSKVLDAFDSTAQPLRFLLSKLAALRKFQSLSGMSCEMLVDRRVLLNLGAYEEVSGGGTGSGLASVMPLDALKTRLQTALDLDAVHVFNAARNTAALGATEALENVGQGVLACIVVDRRSASYDLTSEGTYDSPDGGLISAVSRMPEVVSGIDEIKECEVFHARAGFKPVSPRGVTFGFHFPTAANFT